GIQEQAETPLDEQVAAQAHAAIGSADVVCWVVDGRAGLVAEDHFLATRLRAIAERVLLVVNKIDTADLGAAAMEFHRLGFPDLLAISAEHGLGVGELLDAIVERIGEGASPLEESEETRVAITGRPNVGKSSLLNRIAGEDRAVTSEVAGTTRDSIDTLVELGEHVYRFVDTAGIRRRGKLPNQADRLGVLYAERAIERAQLCLLVLDATEGVTSEDAAIGRKIADSGRGVILTFNKWDLVEDREQAAKELEKQARAKLPHLDFAPALYVSARTGRGVSGLGPLMERVRGEHLKRLPTPELNQFLRNAASRLPPRARDGKEVRFFYITQAGVAPPRFLVFSNRSAGELDASYPRYLTRRLREAYGFEGSPVKVRIRKRRASNSQ
ncbi:MAG TPA: ribosome biogenesis GTPase Der, partial [Vicinamibacteria bacterium]|nr:ribosome biogenesis GTPase Der [Vicinamibacteria bacterium]